MNKHVPDDDSWLIGRGNEVDVILTDDSVSRRHLRITQLTRQRYLLEDLNSSNGTWRCPPNGPPERLTNGYVSPDEPIRLGDYCTTVTALLATVQRRAAHVTAPPAPNTEAAPPLNTAVSDEPYSRYVRTDDGRYVRKPK